MNRIDTLFQREFTRKEFLILIGLSLFAILGISSRIKGITDLLKPNSSTPKATKGFGGGSYGK